MNTTGKRSPAASITQRRDFVRLNREAVRCVRKGLILQCLPREEATEARTGFTVTKKLGGAVIRNRIRRRLREAMRLYGIAKLREDCDYVLIGRQNTLCIPFHELTADLVFAIDFVHRKLDRG